MSLPLYFTALVADGSLCTVVCEGEQVPAGTHIPYGSLSHSGQTFYVCRAHVGADFRYGYQLPGHLAPDCHYHGTHERNMDCLCRNGKVGLEIK